jgi:hypothetical protein
MLPAATAAAVLGQRWQWGESISQQSSFVGIAPMWSATAMLLECELSVMVDAGLRESAYEEGWGDKDEK